MNAVAERAPNPLVVFNAELEQRVPQFAAALPAHIPPERFKRVVLTAVQRNQDLLACSRRSFFNACMLAAQDGLLPDGREGAIVKYKTEAQWLPMVGGIRKKARNSGEISDLWAAVVHKADHFAYQLGDKPFIDHVPNLEAEDPGPVIAAYSVAVLKDGTISRDVMARRDIDKRRKMSKATRDDSPWNTWFEEMCCKTVVKHHAKSLPTSADLDDLLRRDDALYDFEGERAESQPEAKRPRLHALLDQAAEQPKPATADEPQETASESVVTEDAADGAGASQEGDEPAADVPASEQPAEDPDSPRGKILDTLRAAAIKGGKRLRLALGKLSVDDMALLTPADHKALEDSAKFADAKTGGE